MLQLPLSFFTSFFGMNVKSWSGAPSNVSLHIIILWMFPISSLVIVVALLIAFNDFVRTNTVLLMRMILSRLRKKKEHKDVEHVAGTPRPMVKNDLASALQMVNSRGSIMGASAMTGYTWTTDKRQEKIE